MKKLSNLLLTIFLLIPGFLSAQNNVRVGAANAVSESNGIDPDKVGYYFLLGFIIVYILFIVIGLSRATSVLSKTLGDKYKLKHN